MIGGIQPCSFIDFPGHLAAVVFVQGCDLSCKYCHNPELIPRRQGKPLEYLWSFLESRVGLLTGVVVSGGEPTLQPDLLSLVQGIRDRGFAVKLDTNGMHPEVALSLVKYLDYVAVDVKLDPKSTRHLCGSSFHGSLPLETLRGLVLSKTTPCEARTTVVEGYHSESVLTSILESLREVGVTRWFLQLCTGKYQPPTQDLLNRVAERATSLGVLTSCR